MATERVQAGFPSPAQDYVDKKLDLNEFLINNANATFIVRANSLSMLNAGIDINDALIVDRSIEAQHRDIVIACVDNEFTVKRLIIDSKGCWLKAENEGYPDIHPQEGQQFEIWGVVTNVIKVAQGFHYATQCLAAIMPFEHFNVFKNKCLREFVLKNTSYFKKKRASRVLESFALSNNAEWLARKTCK